MNVPHDTGYAVTRTARAFMRVAEARLRPLGLGVAHAPVLVALAEEDGLTQAEIAHRTHIEQPTAAGLLQRMTTAGLLDRSPHPTDRRATTITLSDRAVELLPAALEALTEVDDRATVGLSPQDVATLHDLLGRVLDNLEAMVDTSGPAAPSPPARR